MKKICIGLYGILGVYNFGCEAIVRGAYKFIRDIFGECRIIYFSYSYEYDKKLLSDLGIEIVNVNQNKTFRKRVFNYVRKLLKSEHREFLFDIHELVSDVDYLFSIGGDIYTIPEVLRNSNRYTYYNHLVDFCEQNIEFGKQVVVYGASVGPWGNYKRAVDYYKNNLTKYKAILCREKSSVKYLQKLNFNNVLFFPDPAFQLKSSGEVKRNRDFIGINLSPLSLNELYGSYSETTIKEMASIIDSLYESLQMKLLFLPHVISKDDDDNDLLFMRKIKDNMKYSKYVHIADTSKGFLGIKEQIKDCYIVASARMHCAINALEENIPTLFLSYSQKSIGMCEYIYGSQEWVIDIKELGAQFIPKMKALSKDAEKISFELAERNIEIELDYNKNIEKARKLIC